MALVTDLGLGLESTHVLVTGGGGMIGSAVVSAFIAAGAKVTAVDTNSEKLQTLSQKVQQNTSLSLYPSDSHELFCVIADISNETQLDNAWQKAEEKHGPIECCIALAARDLSVLQHHADGILALSAEQFASTMTTNVTGTFLTARTWASRLAPHLKAQNEQNQNAQQQRLKNCSLIIVGSESGLFGERANADYAASKSAVQGGLLASLKADIPRTLGNHVRVNAIAPGPVDTEQFRRECEADGDQYYADARATVALGKPVDVASVARSVVYLASERWSGSVHGALLRVDCGKEGKLMWRERANELSIQRY